MTNIFITQNQLQIRDYKKDADETYASEKLLNNSIIKSTSRKFKNKRGILKSLG